MAYIRTETGGKITKEEGGSIILEAGSDNPNVSRAEQASISTIKTVVLATLCIWATESISASTIGSAQSNYLNLSRTEQTSLSDSPQLKLDLLAVSRQDSAGVSENRQLQTNFINIIKSDSVAASESITAMYGDTILISRSESLRASEAKATSFSALNLTATEHINLSASPVSLMDKLKVSMSESLSVSDPATIALDTFAEFIAESSSEKIFLIEVRLAEEATGWTLTGGRTYTYEISYLNETITLADASTEMVRKVVSALEVDGTALSVKTSISEVEASAGSYWHDTTNAKLYLHPADNGSPTHHTCMAYFWIYLATKGIILDGKYYEPYVSDGGIPSITQEIQDIFWGISQISVGSVVLLNGRGYFDQMAAKFYWTNKKIRILLGGISLPYNQFVPIFGGQIEKKTFTRDDLTLEIRSTSYDLLRQVPVNHFWVSNLPNLDPSCEGKSIPYAWGIFDERKAPIVTCIDANCTENEINGLKFQICDPAIHPIQSIDRVYVDHGDGSGWVAKNWCNESLVNATFMIARTEIPNFILGTTLVKAAFHGYQSGGNLVEGAPEIVQDILLTVCGYSGNDLDLSTFNNSMSASDCVLNVYLDSEISALSVIEKICKSDFASFDDNGSGKLRYRTMVPVTTGTIAELTSEDILDVSTPAIGENPEKIYYNIRSEYSFSFIDQKPLYSEAEYLAAKYRYGKSERLIVDTYLRSKIDADSLCQRMLWLLRDISPVLNIQLKVAQIEYLIGDRLKITLARTPYESAGGYSDKVFEIIGRNLSCFPVVQSLTLRDLAGFGEYVGRYMLDSAPAWVAASDAERLVSGFWTDDDGYADPPNANSLNKSLWW